MSLSSPKALLAFLQKENLLPQKKFSQNFLIDANILAKIIYAALISRDDYVLEVGPGPGVLTEALLEARAHVLAIEIDTHFSRLLHRLQTDDHRLTTLEGDALKLDLKKELLSWLPKNKKAKIVANLPYAITTPAIIYFFSHRDFFKSFTLMVQKEVAERILAVSGRGYGPLSIISQLFSQVGYGFTVEKTCFFPQPKVRSSVIHFAIRHTLPGIDLEDFFHFLQLAFNKRRKMLTSSFKGIFSAKMLEDLHLNPKCRPEEINPETFLCLYKVFKACPDL